MRAAAGTTALWRRRSGRGAAGRRGHSQAGRPRYGAAERLRHGEGSVPMVKFSSGTYKFGDESVYWVKRVKDGLSSELEWCRRLYEAEAAELILYGRALGLSHSEAEDVLQETFLSLMQRGSAPKEPVHYCLRTFRNRSLNYRRNLWRRLKRELESWRWFERQEGESVQEQMAMKALAELPPEQREVIVLKIWHGLTFEVIGQLQDVSVNTAAGRYRYGLEKLKKSLNKSDYERVESFGNPFGVLEAAETITEN